MKTNRNNSRTARCLLLAGLLFTTVSTAAQRFDRYFEDRTLRLDYILTGDSGSTDISLKEMLSMPHWAGRKSRLAETFLNSNAQITVCDAATDSLLYVNTFATLFQEWQNTAEATKVKRAFELSCLVPYPKQAVDVTVELTDSYRRPKARLTHRVEPSDIQIRPVPARGYEQRYIRKSGNITDCVDIVIVSEGYTADETEKFFDDCRRADEALFSHEPFTAMQQRFNVLAVAVPAEDSGASVPRLGQWKRTTTGTRYDTFYIDRYLMTDRMHTLYDLLGEAPFEHIIVLVNTNRYGGGGIYNSITVATADHATFKPVLVHEFGHAYGGLGDEYDYGDDPISGYHAGIEPWEPNLTTLADFDSKWADLMPKGTPVPTPPADIPDYRKASTEAERKLINEATQRVGVFEGGGYQTHGVYRPAQECRMKINQVDYFCPVCARAIRRITDFYTAH